MFKDIYKRANDKIDTEFAKSRVIAKLNKPVPVKKHYTGAKIAALAACFVLTIAIAGVYERVQKDTAPVSEPPVMVTSETVADVPEKAVAPAKTPKPEIAAKTPVPAVTVQPESVMTDASTDSISETTEPVSNSALVINEVSTGVAMARMALEMPAGNEKEVSPSEYCEYLGKNIPADVPALSGMTDETASQYLAVDESGEFADDGYEFLFTTDDAILKIETTKHIEEVKAKIEKPDLLKSKIGDSDAVVLSENDVITAYFAPGEIGYTITSVNCDKDLLEELLLSLN